uniref:DDE Tnp4 domain-containing protein n=1 Tax=Aplanochytrium stocchinoi TaxID=215587 RepID=A0A7S3PHC7_9STRA|mmetsp:Transcript_6480/g.8243  ORF Transcript_6480/g.8243 Transcript_6480/m.8243 type:complete len:261 (+) Transcript_6480:157-939(+)
MFGIESPEIPIFATLNALKIELSCDFKEKYWPDPNTPEGADVYQKRALQSQKGCPGREDDKFMFGAVGFLDGILFRMQGKPTDVVGGINLYLTPKLFYGIKAQVICDAIKRIIGYSVTGVGRSHVSTCYVASSMQSHIECMLKETSYWIGCDDAYSCTEVHLTPYSSWKDDARNSSFNFHLSSLRMKIENTFGILCARFPRLKNSPANVETEVEAETEPLANIVTSIFGDNGNLHTNVEIDRDGALDPIPQTVRLPQGNG